MLLHPKVQTRTVPDHTAPNGIRTLFLVQLPPPIGLTTFSSETIAQAFCGYIQGASDPAMIADLETFHRTYGACILESPAIPPKERQDLRHNLVDSEHDEFLDAWKLCEIAQQRLTNAQTSLRMLSTTSISERRQLEELVAEWTKKSDEAMAELADAIADSIYVLIGTALEYGFPLAQIWNQVQNSNMAKLWTWEEIVAFANDPEQAGVTPDVKGTILMPNKKDKWTYDFVQAIHPEEIITPTDRCYVVKNQLGKVQKPPSWTPPAIVKTIRACRLMAQMKAQGIMGVPTKTLREFDEWRTNPTFVPTDPLMPTRLEALHNQGVTFITEEEFYSQLGFEGQEDFYAWRRSTGDQTV